MRKQQQGMTTIGVILILCTLGVIGFAALQLTPIFLEHMKIKQVLSDVKGELDGQNASLTDIRKSVDKRLNVEAVTALKAKDFNISRGPNGYILQAEYEQTADYIANVYLLVIFDDSVEILR